MLGVVRVSLTGALSLYPVNKESYAGLAFLEVKNMETQEHRPFPALEIIVMFPGLYPGQMLRAMTVISAGYTSKVASVWTCSN